jgi:hypothetical protein
MKTLDWKNATPAQINLWRNVRALIAWNTITPIYYQGVIAGSEFTDPDNAKLYIALEAEFTYSDVGVNAYSRIVLHGLLGVVNGAIHNSMVAYDSVDTESYVNNMAAAKNFYFQYITSNESYDLMRFNGYRLTTV